MAGYFCEAGSVSAKGAPCAEGTYGNASGLISQANCTACPAGYFDSSAGGGADAECTPCPVGYHTGGLTRQHGADAAAACTPCP